jgi:hypothetical protein
MQRDPGRALLIRELNVTESLPIHVFGDRADRPIHECSDATGQRIARDRMRDTQLHVSHPLPQTVHHKRPSARIGTIHRLQYPYLGAYESSRSLSAPSSNIGSRRATAAVDCGPVHPLAGPIAVAGAEPGDALAAEVVELRSGRWGWGAIIPSIALLLADFPDAYLACLT